jgi:hypothetical protein
MASKPLFIQPTNHSLTPKTTKASKTEKESMSLTKLPRRRKYPILSRGKN